MQQQQQQKKVTLLVSRLNDESLAVGENGFE